MNGDINISNVRRAIPRLANFGWVFWSLNQGHLFEAQGEGTGVVWGRFGSPECLPQSWIQDKRTQTQDVFEQELLLPGREHHPTRVTGVAGSRQATPSLFIYSPILPCLSQGHTTTMPI